MRLLLVDDHASFLDTLVEMLGEAPGMKVVGRAGDGAEGLRLVAELKPDVVIVDFAMPRVDGPTMVRRLKSQPGAPRVIMMSVHAEKEYRDLALAIGADSFLTKSSLYSELVPLLTRLGKEAG